MRKLTEEEAKRQQGQQAAGSDDALQGNDVGIEDNLEQNDVPNTPTGEPIYTIDGREGKYMEMTTIHERYANRPVALEKMCLAQFAMLYVRRTKSKQSNPKLASYFYLCL